MEMNDVLKAIFERRTVRDFKPAQIKDEELSMIIEAGHQAPSAWNRQPWYFTVVQKQSLLDRIADAAKGALQKDSPDTAKAMPWLVGPGFHYFYHAPTVIFVSGQPSNPDAPGDCAIATMNMVYAAQSLGVHSCVVTIAIPAFKTDAGPGFFKDMEIPDGYEPMYAIVLGYPSKPIPPAAPRKEDYVNFIT